MSSAEPALVLENVSKRFGNVLALDDASLNVRRGTVHALLGENGAGKTTLMRVAYGMQSPDQGDVRIRGTPVRLSSPADAIRHGVGMVHQHFTLVPAMTVAENIALGGRGRIDAAELAKDIRVLAEATGLYVDPNARVADLSVPEQQRLELLKALSRDVEILILDEPTAVLAPTEAEELLRQLRKLADGGRAIVLITHKLREALSIADDVTVLRRGKTILQAPRGDVDEDRLVEAMLGQQEGQAESLRTASSVGSVVISARDISVRDARGVIRIRNATFSVRGGEIVGIAGVEGSGHRDLLRAISGRARIASGELDLPDVVGFVPDDRHRDGLVLDMSLVENRALRGAGRRSGLLVWDAMENETSEIIREFDIRGGNSATPARALSGGNQQKFVLGRELQGPPQALVLANATRGLDIRAAASIRRRVIAARADGVAIVMYSGDLDEVLDIADRMVVVFNGTVRELPVDRDAVARAMLGAA